jgi:Calcineurin-like phosphoesterase
VQTVATSDIHGNIDAFITLLADIACEGVDLIANGGDTLCGPLASARTADLLTARGMPMIAGNHERQLLTLLPQRLGRSDVRSKRKPQPSQPNRRTARRSSSGRWRHAVMARCANSRPRSLRR